MLSVIMLNVVTMSVVMLSVVMLRVVMLSVVMMNVVANAKFSLLKLLIYEPYYLCLSRLECQA